LRKSRYIWLGTKKRFDAFTFYFEENEHGLFQVHAYRFEDGPSGSLGTFIAECDEASFQAAGLDRATTAESIAYLEKLFQRHLGGEWILANKREWLELPAVKKLRMHHENAGRIGSPARPAPFAFGCGLAFAIHARVGHLTALRGGGRPERSLGASE